MVPCAPEIPTVRIAHMVTPALATEYGVKGLGEGGAIAPPAAIANAVADAFRDIGASFNETPLTPRRVSEAVDRARRPTAKERRGMKSAPFEYVRPKTVAEASVALGRRGATTAAIAGGQSLMPMLSLRVALIDLLVDISRLDDLKIVTRDARQPLARRADHPCRDRGRQDPRHVQRPDARGSPARSPIARCATTARSAAAWRWPIPPPTGRAV